MSGSYCCCGWYVLGTSGPHRSRSAARKWLADALDEMIPADQREHLEQQLASIHGADWREPVSRMFGCCDPACNP